MKESMCRNLRCWGDYSRQFRRLCHLSPELGRQRAGFELTISRKPMQGLTSYHAPTADGPLAGIQCVHRSLVITSTVRRPIFAVPARSAWRRPPSCSCRRPPRRGGLAWRAPPSCARPRGWRPGRAARPRPCAPSPTGSATTTVRPTAPDPA